MSNKEKRELIALIDHEMEQFEVFYCDVDSIDTNPL